MHNLALWEALRDSRIRLVGVRHEQAAAYAADGYARATGKLGVALTTTGPGAANTLGAVGEAWASRSPVLVIATDIPSSLRRPGVYRGVLHETTDQAAMFAPVVKGAHRALAPAQVAAAATAAVTAGGGAAVPARVPGGRDRPPGGRGARRRARAARRPRRPPAPARSRTPPPASPPPSGRCCGSAAARARPGPRSRGWPSGSRRRC